MKCHKQAQSHTITEDLNISMNMKLPDPDANLGNPLFILKAFIFLFHTYGKVAKIRSVWGKKWFSFNKLTLYHQITPASSTVALPIKPL